MTTHNDATSWRFVRMHDDGMTATISRGYDFAAAVDEAVTYCRAMASYGSAIGEGEKAASYTDAARTFALCASLKADAPIRHIIREWTFSVERDDDGKYHATDETPGLDEVTPGIVAPTEPYMVESRDQYNRPILTVGALAAILANHDPRTHVLVSLPDDYYNVTQVAEPDRAGDPEQSSLWSAVTLFISLPTDEDPKGSAYDSRQF